MTAILKTLPLLAGLLLAPLPAISAPGDNQACLECHDDLAKTKVAHGAQEVKCGACHDAIDASTRRHKSSGKLKHGLSLEPPALCGTCHDRKLFEGKVVHGPVAAGQCLTCHDVHSADIPGMLKKPASAQCLDCHPEIAQGPHVVAGISRRGHPIGNEGKQAEDPSRPGRTFSCASCHEPHRSDLPRLARFANGMNSCTRCHKI